MFKIVMFIIIWGFTIGAAYLVWLNYGVIAGIIFFLFGAGLAGAMGMAIILLLSKILGLKVED
ncbi:MAG: hypothetical protein ACC651_17885 [Candidatus Scalindua sp.]